MNESLWKQHFPKFLGSNDKVLSQLMDAAILIKIPAGRQIFYPGKSCENYLLMALRQRKDANSVIRWVLLDIWRGSSFILGVKLRTCSIFG